MKDQLRTASPAAARKGRGKLELTKADYDAWKKGEVRLSEIAVRFGSSVAAVSKAMKRLKPSGEPVALKPPAASLPAGQVPAGDPMLVQPIWAQGEKGYTEDDVMLLASSATFGALLKAHKKLASQEELGPTALKAYAGVVDWAVLQLDKLGVISLQKAEQENLPQLTIRVMSAEEEAALRRGDHLHVAQDEAA